MLKKIKLIIILVAVGVGVLITGLIIKENVNKQRLMQANERMVQQIDYMDSLATFVNQIDTVTASYIAGEMDKDAYIKRHEILNNEFEILKGSFNKWLEENPIDMSTQSFISTEGETQVQNANKHTEELLKSVFKDDGEPYPLQELAYKYLSAKETLQNDFLGYVTAYKWMEESNTYEDDLDSLVDEMLSPVNEVKNETASKE